MNLRFQLPLFAALALGFSAGVRAQTPYLETAPLSILWNFTTTGVTNTAIGLTPIIPGSPGALDPDKLRPVDRVSTDIGSPIVYSIANGDQAFFTKHLLRNIAEGYANSYKTLAAQTPDPLALAELAARIKYLQKAESSTMWELTAVRSAQTTVAGHLSTPYSIFLTRIERSADNPSANFDTGLRLVPLHSAGNSIETLSGGQTTKATGSYTIHFRLEFSAFYANDPLNALDVEDIPEAEEGEDYNTAGDYWEAWGTGYMTHSIRSTPAPYAVVTPTKIKMTGHGSWYHRVYADSLPTGAGGGGVAPLSIKMGDAKFQNRHMFPDYTAD